MKSYVVFVNAFINGASSFSQNIQVPIIPKYLKVSSTYKHDLASDEPALSFIRCPALITNSKNGIICSIGEALTSPDVKFECSQNINGDYLFEVINYQNLLSTSRSGYISIVLEFIE